MQSVCREGELQRRAAAAEAVLRCPLAGCQRQQRVLAVDRCQAAGLAAALLRRCHSPRALCGLPNAQVADHLPQGRCCLCGSAWR